MKEKVSLFWQIRLLFEEWSYFGVVFIAQCHCNEKQVHAFVDNPYLNKHYK